MYCVYKNYYILDPLHFHSQVKPEIKSKKLSFIEDEDVVNLCIDGNSGFQKLNAFSILMKKVFVFVTKLFFYHNIWLRKFSSITYRAQSNQNGLQNLFF